MKKLFFAALLASVAIGGAFASSSKVFAAGNLWIESNTSSTPDYTCEGGVPSCAGKYSGTIPTLYNSPKGTVNRTTVTLGQFTYTP